MPASSLSRSYGMPAASAYTTKRATFLDYFRGASLVAWLVVMLFGFWFQSQWFSRFEEDTQDRMFQFFQIGFAIMLAGHITLGVGPLLGNPFLIPTATDLRAALFGTFFLLMLVLSPMSLTPGRSALYAAATWATMCLCSVIWINNYDVTRRMLGWAGLLMIGFLVVLIFTHGYNFGAVGGIPRNRYAGAAFTGMVYLTLWKGKLKWLPIVVGAGLIILVNSRGALVGMGLACVVYVFLVKGFNKTLFYGVVGLLAIFILDLIPVAGKESGMITRQIFRVNAADRGVESGLTGRTNLWAGGIERFSRRPVFGYGFRSRVNQSEDTMGSHSGFIDLLQDAGLVGGALVFTALFLDLLRRIQTIYKLRKAFDAKTSPTPIKEAIHINALTASIYFMNLFYLMIEPIYLNLGNPVTIMFFILICSPMLSPAAKAVMDAHRSFSAGAWGVQPRSLRFSGV